MQMFPFQIFGEIETRVGTTCTRQTHTSVTFALDIRLTEILWAECQAPQRH